MLKGEPVFREKLMIKETKRNKWWSKFLEAENQIHELIHATNINEYLMLVVQH